MKQEDYIHWAKVTINRHGGSLQAACQDIWNKAKQKGITASQVTIRKRGGGGCYENGTLSSILNGKLDGYEKESEDALRQLLELIDIEEEKEKKAMAEREAVKKQGLSWGTLSQKATVRRFDISMQLGQKRYEALVGPAGCGKSTLIKHLENAYEGVCIIDFDMEAVSTAKFYTLIKLAIKPTLSMHGAASERAAQVVKTLRDMGVRTLIFDEFDMIRFFEHDKQKRVIFEQTRQLFNKGFNVILVGTPELEEEIHKFAGDAHHARRINPVHRMDASLKDGEYASFWTDVLGLPLIESAPIIFDKASHCGGFGQLKNIKDNLAYFPESLNMPIEDRVEAAASMTLSLQLGKGNR